MGVGRWILRGAALAGVVAMTRSKSAVVRGVGKAGGLLLAPRLAVLLGRKVS